MNITTIYITRLKVIPFIVIGLIFSANVICQTSNVGTYSVLNIFYKANNKVTLWSELQTRSNNLYSDFYYTQYKGGVIYKLPNSDNSIFIGGGRYSTYSLPGNFTNPIKTDELRLWEQLTLNNTYAHFKVEHRYRLEHRWINNDYKTRLRYRINPSWIINKRTIEPHALIVNVFDEIFLGNNNPHFETNRYYIGLGYVYSKLLTFQIGLLHQTDYSALGTETGKDFIQTSIILYTQHKMHKRDNTTPNLMD